jgi:membrane-associated phospholipid phosphatase
MTINDLSSSYLWHLFTRLGEAQILLPTALIVVATMLRRADARPLAAWWLALLSVATLVTTASKVAFIGWGIGWPRLNFTGISGHAMFAAAVCPLLLGTLAARASRVGRYLAVATGGSLAVLIGVSRVVIGVHSVSEVLAGLLVGGVASTAVFALVRRLPGGVVGPAVPAVILLWLVLMPLHAPASTTHSLITSISLTLSGREVPYTRTEMLRELQRRDNLPQH